MIRPRRKEPGLCLDNDELDPDDRMPLPTTVADAVTWDGSAWVTATLEED